MAISMGDEILRKIIRNHGCEILTVGDDTYASFGDRLSVEVTPVQAEVLAQWDEEEN